MERNFTLLAPLGGQDLLTLMCDARDFVFYTDDWCTFEAGDEKFTVRAEEDVVAEGYFYYEVRILNPYVQRRGFNVLISQEWRPVNQLPHRLVQNKFEHLTGFKLSF